MLHPALLRRFRYDEDARNTAKCYKLSYLT